MFQICQENRLTPGRAALAAILICAKKEQKPKNHLFYFFQEYDVDYLFFGIPGEYRFC
jgi:hypothetical protein